MFHLFDLLQTRILPLGDQLVESALEHVEHAITESIRQFCRKIQAESPVVLFYIKVKELSKTEIKQRLPLRRLTHSQAEGCVHFRHNHLARAEISRHFILSVL